MRDGVAHAVMLGSGENYFSVYAIHLQASVLQIGFLSALPPFLSTFFQFGAVALIERLGKRRSMLVTSATAQALLLLPIAVLGSFHLPGQTLVSVLIAIVILYWGASGFIAPLWTSLIGDLVPPEQRGRFFGRRNVYIGIATVSSLALAGLTLELSRVFQMESIGFAIIFGVALLARLYSARCLSQYPDPKMDLSPEHRFSLWDFLRRSHHSNFARFVYFQASMNFAVFLAAPYFAVYMLRDLGFNYFQFTLITLASLLAQFLPMHYWGQISDSFGNKKVLTISGAGVILAPILWLFSSNFYWLIFAQLYGGFVWAGYNLATANFMFDAVSPPKRARCVAYQSLVNAIMLLLGSLLGAWLTGPRFAEPMRDLLPVFLSHGSEFPMLFLISGGLRLFLLIFWVGRFHEVRTVEQIGHRELVFRISHLRPIAGATFGFLMGRQRRR